MSMMSGRSDKVKFTVWRGRHKTLFGGNALFFLRYLMSSNNPGIFFNGICLALKIKIYEHAVLFGNRDWCGWWMGHQRNTCVGSGCEWHI